MFIRTIIFHNTITTMLVLAKFLTVRERRWFESISTSWEFISNINLGLPAMVALGHLWYNSGPHFVGSPSAAQSGTNGSQVAQAMPAHGPRPGCLGHACPRSIDPLPEHPYIESAHSNRAGPIVSWVTRLRVRNELSGQLSDRHAFNLVRSANNGTVLNRHRRNHMSQPTIDSAWPWFTFTPWFFSTIANIANRALVSTYISQVTGNHLTSTGLSMAKHIFDPGPIQAKGTFLDKEFICIKWFQSTLIT